MAKQEKTQRGRSQDRRKVAGGEDYEIKYDNMKTKTSPLKLDLKYEEAMKKALNTPLPKKIKTIKKVNKMNAVTNIHAYEVIIEEIANKYLSMYDLAYPEKDFEKAKTFMDEQYENYRKEIATFGINLIHEAGVGSELANDILHQNAHSMGLLYAKILESTIG